MPSPRGGGWDRPPGPGWYPPPVPLAPGGAPLAGFGTRLLAYLLDMVIVMAVLLALFGLLIGAGVLIARSVDGQLPDWLAALLVATGYLVAFGLQLVVLYVYFVTLMHPTGQTVGKRVTKIRTVRGTDGGPIDLRTARRRWVVQHLTAIFAPYFGYADGLWQLWDKPYQQCLHDKCADTVVVKVPV